MRIMSRALIGAAVLVFSSAATGQASAPNDPRAVVEAKFAAVNRHAIPDIVALYAPDAEIIASDFCKPRKGHADVERIYKGIFTAVPDAVANVQEYVVQGDRVAVRFTVQSRLPGRSFDVPIMNFFTVKDGLIVSDEGRFDNGGRPCNP